MARLTADFKVRALLRQVDAAGGSAMVLARGDATAGGVLVLAVERGADPVFWERGIGPDGRTALVRSGPADSDPGATDSYWRRRRARDPDLWVVELDIAAAERFAAETLCAD